MNRLKSKLQKFFGVTALVDNQKDLWRALNDVGRRIDLLASVEPPAAFVCVLIEGKYDGKPKTLGKSASLEQDDVIVVETQLPMSDIRVIVFADLRRVDLLLFCGVDPIPAAVGSCPVGYVAGPWEPGVDITVSCRLRDRR